MITKTAFMHAGSINMSHAGNRFPKTLLLSWNVPPAATAIASVTANLAQQFGQHDLIVVGEPDSATPEEQWRAEWPKIVPIEGPGPGWGRGARYQRKLWYPRLRRQALAIAQVHKVKAVLAIFPSEEYLLAGLAVARSLGVPFYPYLHNTYLDQREGLERVLARYVQSRAFRQARHVFVMSEGMTDLFRRRYPEISAKCSALVHPWSDPVPEFIPPKPAGAVPHFVFIGSLNPSNEDAAGRVFRAVSSLPKARLTVLGPSRIERIRELGASQCDLMVKRVSRDELMSRVSEADVALLPHGLTGRWSPVEYETMFPTKTIEYLHSRVPIFAHTPKDCFLTRFLRKHGCAVVEDAPDDNMVRDSLIQLCSSADRRAEVVRNALKVAPMFQASAVAGELRRVLGK